ncbi:MAG: hypothetical protein ATN36_00575 [Epulopiscium sp. Nele67-Bin005]|nr:MAG: hypothetical protein ATN36_00575 [Epulopiscium sp. Nele67-Bin005]
MATKRKPFKYRPYSQQELINAHIRYEARKNAEPPLVVRLFRNRHYVGLFICGFAVFLACSGFIYINVQFSNQQTQLQSLNIELQEVKSRINATETIIATQINLDYVRQRASEELGMTEPSPHQIIYLTLPEESYTIYGK